jgi:hypothetical protein
MNLPKDILKIIISKTDLPFNEISTLSKDVCALSFASYNFAFKINFGKLITQLCEAREGRKFPRMCDTYFLADSSVLIKYLILNPSVDKKHFANETYYYKKTNFNRNINERQRSAIFTENSLCDYLCNFFQPEHKNILACYFMRYENPNRDKKRIEALLNIKDLFFETKKEKHETIDEILEVAKLRKKHGEDLAKKLNKFDGSLDKLFQTIKYSTDSDLLTSVSKNNVFTLFNSL